MCAFLSLCKLKLDQFFLMMLFFRYVSCVIRVLYSATGVFCTSFVSEYLQD